MDARRKLEYNSRHDAYYNVQEDKWVEGMCADPLCQFCVGRPEKPSQVVQNQVPEGTWHQ